MDLVKRKRRALEICDILGRLSLSDKLYPEKEKGLCKVLKSQLMSLGIPLIEKPNEYKVNYYYKTGGVTDVIIKEPDHNLIGIPVEIKQIYFESSSNQNASYGATHAIIQLLLRLFETEEKYPFGIAFLYDPNKLLIVEEKERRLEQMLWNVHRILVVVRTPDRTVCCLREPSV